MSRRFDYVDFLRGWAAIWVLVCHYRWFFARGVGEWRTDVPLPAYNILWPVYEFGELAVYLFWILSGFVFYVAYGVRNVSLADFLVHRFARLYPLHFVTLILIAVLQALSWQLHGQWQVYGNNDAPHFFLHLLFASNWLTMEHSFNAPIWSVSIEVLIYFLFIVYLMMSASKLRVAGGIAMLSLVAWYFTRSPVAMCSALFFMGVCLAIVLPQIEGKSRKLLPLSAICVLVGLAVACLAANQIGKPHWVAIIVTFAVVPAILAFFVSLDLNFSNFPKRFRHVGLSTYAVYLLHMPILILLRIFLAAPPPLHLFVITVFVAGILTYHFFERPMQDWIRQRFTESRQSIPA